MENTGIFLLNQNSGKLYPLSPETDNIIGRQIGEQKGEADIPLAHPAVSQKHARLFLDQESHLWHVQNLGRNTTLVDNRNCEQPTAVKHGDNITIGPYQLVFWEKFSGDETMEQPKPSLASYSKEWDDEEQTPLGNLIEMVAIAFLLLLTAFILYCCFS